MGIKQLIASIGNLVNISLGLMVGLALLAFFWGIVKFLIDVGQGGKPDEGKNIMKWGLISLFVMVSVWGIIAFVQSAFDLPRTATQNLPSRNTYVWPTNQPMPGNTPEPGNLPNNPLNLPGSFEPFKK